MAENCTIYCKELNLEKLDRLLQTQSMSPSLVAGGPMVIYGDRGSLRFTQKVFIEPGDDFCRLLLSTCAFVEGTTNGDVEVKKNLVSHIESCELVLGVVADPAFDADERYHAVVFEIAKALDGVVFNGHEMLDGNGELLMAGT